MAMVKICDGRSQLYRWDTGVQVEMCGCSNVTEAHFVTAEGVIKRDVVNNICNVPDNALTKAGMLVVYAFARTADEGVTRHEFRIAVRDRPKPADYIDPPDESDTIDLIAERVAGLIEPGSGSGGGITKETDPTVPGWAKQKEKPTYTADEVGAQPKGDYALKSDIPEIPAPYVLPVATADTLGGVKVGEGLQMTGDVLGVKPEGEYELIETITLDEDMVIERTQEPDGTPYKFSAITVMIKKAEGITLKKAITMNAYSNKTYQPLYLPLCEKTEELWGIATVERYRGMMRRTRCADWAILNSTSALMEVPFIMFNNPFPKGDAIKRIMTGVAWPAGLTIQIWGVRANA